MRSAKKKGEDNEQRAVSSNVYLAITSLAETYKRKRNMHSLLKKHYPKQV
ncbi:hypothetical protein CAG58_00550 [Vibrio sp. V31_P5A7T61]|nr:MULTISPECIES: hypothetical protein [unclassified Vibrio]NAW60459.1 hypothetical protein [Vibrio sp. V31_P5A7T61]NAX02253.1 hypothetical protein [Vibrio sp. V34_P3A8T189]NAX07118.1 hypothetical protein [Vibrio sp. V40_P2S30T141]NAX65416.1 hypothetical protein [Vibrio sp. V32_P6A28T40]